MLINFSLTNSYDTFKSMLNARGNTFFSLLQFDLAMESETGKWSSSKLHVILPILRQNYASIVMREIDDFYYYYYCHIGIYRYFSN